MNHQFDIAFRIKAQIAGRTYKKQVRTRTILTPTIVRALSEVRKLRTVHILLRYFSSSVIIAFQLLLLSPFFLPLFPISRLGFAAQRLALPASGRAWTKLRRWETAEVQKLLENRAESHLSGARCVGRHWLRANCQSPISQRLASLFLS